MDNAPLFNDNKPPWVVFGYMRADDLTAYLNQGETQAWFDQLWRPFWADLSVAQKTAYLEHWEASPAWVEAIGTTFDPETFDLEADARESEAHLKAFRDKSGTRAKLSILKRMFGGQ